MCRSKMRYFLYVSFLSIFCACNQPVYRNLQPGKGEAIRTDVLRPEFDRALYRCVVDGKLFLKKFHLSGILYLKSFSDTGVRIVFQGEMGNTFFDFGWDHNDSFTVYRIMPEMNRPALIKTLRKDFELLLLKGISAENEQYEDEHGNVLLKYHLQSGTETKKGYAYYLLNRQADQLIQVTNADDKHKVVVMEMTPPAALKTLPDTLLIRHLKAHFTVDMKKIRPDAE